MRVPSDSEIIDSVNRGNTGDFALLVDRYKDRAFSMLRRMLKNQMDAEEALQDSFLNAYMGLKDFRRESEFSTWFYRIVYNRAISLIQSKKRKIEIEMSSLDENLFLGRMPSNPQKEGGNLPECLLRIIDRLPLRNALAIILFYSDDLSIAEIASVMDISEANAKVILHRGRSVLKELLIRNNYMDEL